MSVFSVGASNGIYTKDLDDVFGIGATINSAGVFQASTGPEIRRVTGSPNGVVSDFGGSLALDVTNGTVYVNTSTGNVAGTGWRFLAGSASSNGVSRLFSSTADSSTIIGNGAVQYFDVTYSVPANTLTTGSVLRVTGDVRRVNQNVAETIALQVEVGGTAFSAIPGVNVPAGTRAYFDLTLTARAAPSGNTSCVGAGSILFPNVQVGAAGNVANLATNGALVVRVGCNMPASANNTAVLEQLVVTVS